MSFERYSHTLYFWELSWNIDAFYHTMKRVSISVFTDFSQSSLFAMWNGNTIRRGQEFLQSPNSSSARWRYFITTTRILHVFTFLCKLEPLLLKLRRDYQIYKMKGIAMTPSCKWPITCTSKDKPGDLFKFFLARLKIAVDSRNYPVRLEHTREWFWHGRKFGVPGMPKILARGACWVLISC